MRDRFRAGDPAALGEAYDEHAQVLYRYALRVCGDPAAAEDAVSAAFLEAWRCRGALHADGGSLRPWLLGIATNILRGTAREARRRDAALARLADRGVLPDFSDEVVTRLTGAEQLRAAGAALRRLRRRDREVFALVVWAGLDYAAAAEALDIPVGTVRSRLSRARDRLRTLADAELRAPRTGRRRPSRTGSTPAGPADPPVAFGPEAPAARADLVEGRVGSADRATRDGPKPGTGPAGRVAGTVSPVRAVPVVRAGRVGPEPGVVRAGGFGVAGLAEGAAGPVRAAPGVRSSGGGTDALAGLLEPVVGSRPAARAAGRPGPAPSAARPAPRPTLGAARPAPAPTLGAVRRAPAAGPVTAPVPVLSPRPATENPL
ncbi:sigma-70 family RNA polymerase sigma factor [Streptomyces sp. NPDC053493]|uniref:sigma-70 family RNA polymerase sigma factor n=1 Tax=Streptomyces sp. NPDC053493 TaxID=3365705 RepID=UPI0037D342D8